MMSRRPEAKPLSVPVFRWIVRLFLAACAVIALVFLLVLGGAIVQSRGVLSPSAMGDLRSPWVGGYRPDRLGGAAAQQPRSTLTTRMTITAGGGDGRAGTSVFTVKVEISGAPDDPVMAALRDDAGRTPASEVVSTFAGWLSFSSFSPQYTPATVRVDSATATAVLNGWVSVPTGRLRQIDVDEPGWCTVLAQRTLQFDLPGFAVIGVRAHSAQNSDCGLSSSWPNQADTSTLYEGDRSVTVTLRKVLAAKSLATTPQSLLTTDPPVSDMLQALMNAALTAVPLTVVWWRLRRSPLILAARTVSAALGALLVFHVVVALCQALTSPYYAVLRQNADRIQLAGQVIHLPYETLDAALVVALAYAWRQASLDTVARRPRPVGRTGRGIVAFATLSAALVGAVVLGPIPVRDDVGAYSWVDWLHGWYGLFAVGAGCAVVAGLVVPPLLRRFPLARPPVSAWSTLGACGGALVFALTELLGFAYAPATAAQPTQDIDTWFDRVVPNWLAWTISLPGVITAVGVLVLVSGIPASVAYLLQRSDSWLRRWRAIAAAGLAVLACGTIVWPLIAAANALSPWRVGWVTGAPSSTDWFTSTPGMVSTLAVVIVATAAVAAALMALLGAGPPLRGRAAIAATLVIALLVFEPLSLAGGVLGTVAAAVPPLAAGAVVWLTLGRMSRHVLTQTLTRPGLRITRRLPRLRGAGWLIAVLLSVPFSFYGDEGRRIAWYHFSLLAGSIDACIPLLSVAVLILAAHRIGRTEPGASVSTGSSVTLRLLAVLIAILGLLTPTATAAGIPVAFIVGWLLIEFWLMPRGRVAAAAGVATGDQPRQDAVEAVFTQTRHAVRARASAELERGLRKDLTADGVSPDVRQERLERVTSLAMQRRATRSGVTAAFSSYAGDSPWQRAKTFGVIGLIAGLPWMLVDIGALLTGHGTFLFVDSASGILVLLRFALAGVVVGLAYPAVRGRTGLAKGLSLFVTLAIPGLCVILLPNPHAPGVIPAALLQLTQWLSFGLVLGFASDLRQLRMAGLSWRSLSDVHNLTALTASLSSVVLAVATAAAAAIGTGAAGIMLDRLLPPPPPAASATAPK